MENASGESLVVALSSFWEDHKNEPWSADALEEVSRLLSDSRMCFPDESTIQKAFKQHWLQLSESLGEVAVMAPDCLKAWVKETAKQIFDDLDRRWVAAVLGGDEDAWRALLRALQRLIGRVRRLDEDVLQDAFVRLFVCVNKGGIKGGFDIARTTSRSLKAWLITTATNKFIDNLRKNKRMSLAEDFGEGFLEAVSAAIESAEVEFIEGEAKARRAMLLAQALGKMPPEFREIIELRYYSEWSVEQICKKLAVSGSNLRSKIARAHARLRKFMRKNQETVVRRTGKDGKPLGRPKGSGKKKATSMQEVQL